MICLFLYTYLYIYLLYLFFEAEFCEPDPSNDTKNAFV